jgi:hypothetical protein
MPLKFDTEDIRIKHLADIEVPGMDECGGSGTDGGAVVEV